MATNSAMVKIEKKDKNQISQNLCKTDASRVPGEKKEATVTWIVQQR